MCAIAFLDLNTGRSRLGAISDFRLPAPKDQGRARADAPYV